MKNIVSLGISVLCLAGLSMPANAVPIFSNAASVTISDRTAQFNTFMGGEDLTSYTEGTLNFALPGGGFTFEDFQPFLPGDPRGFGGFHYASSGNNSFVIITGTDGAVFHALQFLLGDGFGGPSTNLLWETRLASIVTGGNLESGLTLGTIAGWTDAVGFDELRVAAAPGFVGLTTLGDYQAIALDDVSAQIAPLGPATVPEIDPNTAVTPVVLLFGCLAMLCGRPRGSVQPT